PRQDDEDGTGLRPQGAGQQPDQQASVLGGGIDQGGLRRASQVGGDLYKQEVCSTGGPTYPPAQLAERAKTTLLPRCNRCNRNRSPRHPSLFPFLFPTFFWLVSVTSVTRGATPWGPGGCGATDPEPIGYVR